ncbi:Conserved_hypothetical protein [Hexamita inflata]|uniref:Uncharacterized protein n=1 Tax=Hexamita inflata TaxID=28002 RepID=A0AA86TUN6_9EUKA|nr:Conserved hypothetical protein [Hexamita inflata]
MEIFDNNTPLNNRLHKLCEKEVNNIASLNFDNSIFSALFLDVCLYKKFSQSVLAIQSVEKIIQFVSIQKLLQREEDITNKYEALSLETIKLDIEHQIQLRDQMIKIQQEYIQQKQSDNLENKFVTEHMDSLKFFDHLKNSNENIILIVRKCNDLIFDEVPTKIRNFERIQNMMQLQNMQIITLVINNWDIELELNMIRNLVALDLSANKIESCQYLVFPNSLKILNLSCNNISTLDQLHLVNLVELDLRNNKLKDIQQISKIHSLVKVNLSNNALSNIFPLYGNESIVELDISNNYIRRLNGHDQAKHGNVIMKNLKVLILQGNQSDNISDLRYISQLQHIDVSKNKSQFELQFQQIIFEVSDGILSYLFDYEDTIYDTIYDLMPLQYLYRIRYINLEGNSINNIWPLKRLVNLEALNVKDNLIVDINVVQYLIRLKRFNFSYNFVQDINVLFSVQLEEIQIEFNCVSQEYMDQLIEQNIIQKEFTQKTYSFGANEEKDKVKANRITKIFRTNDNNQNTNESIHRTKTQFKQMKRNISELIHRSVMNQVHFTRCAVELFQSLQ